MNISFPTGIVIVFLAMITGMAYGNPFDSVFAFWNVPSLLITVVGTMAALFATFPAKVYKRIFQHLPIILGLRKQDPVQYVNIMTELSQEARRNGMLALEDSVARFDDAFLRESVMLIVDEPEPYKVREQLDSELKNIEARHALSWDIYDKGAALAPGFGMIGTLVGLVLMLKGMNFDEEGGASALAQNMAIALITTFYGTLMANIIFIPAACQLRVAHYEEMVCKGIIIEGVISIQAGEPPGRTNSKLMAFLTYKEREQAKALSESAAILG